MKTITYDSAQWQLVPKKADSAMLSALSFSYEAMLAAAPAAPIAVQDDATDPPGTGSRYHHERAAQLTKSTQPSAAPEQAAEAPDVLIYPAELTPELRAILGTMCFQIIREVALYRTAGHDIPTRAEDEQAFILDRFMRAYLKHGAGWSSVINEELHSMQAALKARIQQEPKA